MWCFHILGAITSFKATKASEFTIEFDKAQPETATIAITKGGAAVDGKLTWNEGRTSAVFAGTANFANGEYTATVTNGTASVTANATVEDEKVDEIVITSPTALTSEDNTSAYIYYDVFNQYKESIRSSTSINWTISSSKKYTVDKSTGRITVTKEKDKNDKANTFNYGETIYLVGVNVKSGKSVTASVTVGMAQAIDTIEMVGFVNKNNKTKIEPSLPKNFAKNTYYLVYTAKDQNGNPLESEKYDSSKITFISDAPLLMESSIKEAGDVYSIDGKEYSSVLVNPGNYVDKGGEVNITAVSNKTGKRTTKNFQVGANGILQSLVLDVPNTTIADGDGTVNNERVKIPFVAKDTEGRTVTNYDTIIRSSNAVTLNAGDNTKLEIVEENDGTAGIYWHDSISATAFDNTSASDDVDRSILLSSIVVGGEANNVMLSVSDMRRPVAIKSIKLNDDNNNAIINGNTANIDFYNKDNNAAPVRYIDQYGADLLPEKAAAFFDMAKAGTGFNGDKYAIAVKTTSADKENLFNKNSANKNEADTASGSAILTTDGNLGFTASLNNDKRTSVTVKYSIAVQEKGSGDFSDTSKVKNETYTIVHENEIKDNLSMTVAGSKYKIKTLLSNRANGNDLAKEEYTNIATACAIDETDEDGNKVNEGYVDNDGNLLIPISRKGKEKAWTDDRIIKVTGTTRDGITLSVPKNEIKEAEKSDVMVRDADGGKVVAGVKKGNLKWYELYDVNTAKSTRISATKNLAVEVYNTPVKAKVKVSDEMVVPASIKFTQNWGILNNSTVVNPSTNVKSDNFDKDTGKIKDATNIIKLISVPDTTGDLNVIVYDQFGREITTSDYDFSVSFKVSDIKESTSDMTYMANSFAVNKNNTSDMTISGAEIGDTYKLTASVDGFNVGAVLDVTVGSDKAAKQSTNKDDDTDEIFRKNVLGMNR